jgi:hypothetical protein
MALGVCVWFVVLLFINLLFGDVHQVPVQFGAQESLVAVIFHEAKNVIRGLIKGPSIWIIFEIFFRDIHHFAVNVHRGLGIGIDEFIVNFGDQDGHHPTTTFPQPLHFHPKTQILARIFLVQEFLQSFFANLVCQQFLKRFFPEF